MHASARSQPAYNQRVDWNTATGVHFAANATRAEGLEPGRIHRPANNKAGARVPATTGHCWSLYTEHSWICYYRRYCHCGYCTVRPPTYANRSAGVIHSHLSTRFKYLRYNLESHGYRIRSCYLVDRWPIYVFSRPETKWKRTREVRINGPRCSSVVDY